MTRKRGYLAIARDILTITQDGAGITKIVYDGNINFNIAKGHLDGLVARGLASVEVVKYRRDKKVLRWTTTDRGRAFLMCFETVSAMWDIGEIPAQAPGVAQI